MARTKKRTHAGVRRHHAGSRKPNPTRRVHHRRRSNPGGLNIAAMLKESVAVIGGAAGSKLLTQMVLSTSNTGVMGYLGNAVSTGILAFFANMFLKSKELTQGVILGGVVQIVLRVIQDYSLLGQYSSQLGIGDYQVVNNVSPATAVDGLTNGQQRIPPGWASAGVPTVPAAGMSGYYGWDASAY